MSTRRSTGRHLPAGSDRNSLPQSRRRPRLSWSSPVRGARHGRVATATGVGRPTRSGCPWASGTPYLRRPARSRRGLCAASRSRAGRSSGTCPSHRHPGAPASDASRWESPLALRRCPVRAANSPGAPAGAEVEESSRGSTARRSVGGQGRGRTADLPIFSRTLVPTELPALVCTLRDARSQHSSGPSRRGDRLSVAHPLRWPNVSSATPAVTRTPQGHRPNGRWTGSQSARNRLNAGPRLRKKPSLCLIPARRSGP